MSPVLLTQLILIHYWINWTDSAFAHHSQRGWKNGPNQIHSSAEPGKLALTVHPHQAKTRLVLMYYCVLVNMSNYSCVLARLIEKKVKNQIWTNIDIYLGNFSHILSYTHYPDLIVFPLKTPAWKLSKKMVIYEEIISENTTIKLISNITCTVIINFFIICIFWFIVHHMF